MKYVKKLDLITKTLLKSRKVNSYDSNGELESDRLAHSLLDMEESFKKIIEVYLPKLTVNEISESEIDEALLDIGDELKHIIYHIKDPKFYRYLVNNGI